MFLFNLIFYKNRNAWNLEDANLMDTQITDTGDIDLSDYAVTVEWMDNRGTDCNRYKPFINQMTRNLQVTPN